MRQQERTYYQNERARITFRQAIVDGKAYPIDDIQAVRLEVKHADTRWPVLIVGIGSLSAVAGLLADMGALSAVLSGLGGIAVAAGVLMILLGKVQYVVTILRKDGIVQALHSPHKDVAAPIVDAIEAVLIVRGR